MTDTLFKIAIAIGLAVVLPFLVYYGVATFDPPPEHRDYVDWELEAGPAPVPRESLEGEADKPRGDALTDQERAQRLARLQEQQAAFEQAEAAFGRTLYFVAAPIGFLLVLAAGFIPLPGVGPGLVLGGGATVTVAYVHEWERLSHAWRFGSLILALVALLFVAWRIYAIARQRAP